MDTEQYIKIPKRIFKPIIVTSIIIGVIGFWLFISWYSWGPLRRDRAHIGVAILAASDTRQEIEKQLLAGNKYITVMPPKNLPPEITHFLISTTGEIAIKISTQNAFFVLTPKLQSNSISWHCYGTPSKYVPSSCRNEPYNKSLKSPASQAGTPQSGAP